MKTAAMLLIAGSILGLAACTKENNELEDFANDNAIVLFTLQDANRSVAVEVYKDSLLLEVPASFTLDNAKASYELTERSAISPDPASITDWSVMHIFNLVAPDGKTERTYTYKPKYPEVQSGVEGFYILKSQADVEALGAKNLNKVNGIVVAGTPESPITDLSALSTIEEVEFQIRIDNYQGRELSGFNNVRTAASIFVSSDSLEVVEFSALEKVNNLNIGYSGGYQLNTTTPRIRDFQSPNLRVIHNSLIIQALTLQSFTGFRSLEKIGGAVTIVAGASTLEGFDKLQEVFDIKLTIPNATSLVGLGSLRNVTRKFELSFMQNLTSLNGSNLQNVRMLNFNNCTKLADLTALSSVTELDQLFISGSLYLESLEGLHNVERITHSLGIFSIGRNSFGGPTGLANFHGLRSLKGVGNIIEVRFCPNIRDFCDISEALSNFKGAWTVTNNAYNPTLTQVQTNCKL